MKERPILFSGEMVRAILEGSKTQTRRVIKPQPEVKYVAGYGIGKNMCGDAWTPIQNNTPTEKDWKRFCSKLIKYCPHGVVGDRLWVRETWRVRGWWPDEPFNIQYRADMSHQQMQGDIDPDWEERIWEQITEEMDSAGVPYDEDGVYQFEGEPPLKWRPSIFMPRAASRILLEVTDVRVERLQEISQNDARNEGVNVWWWKAADGFAEIGPFDYEFNSKHVPENKRDYKKGFIDLWNSINAKRGYSWDENPWVWVVKFKVLEPADAS
ncbi:MAG: hypothetical protein SVT56_03750 [Chloroflexota bacterium]|nr:hypothetical protein [Chloroflexota bacterium]